MSRCCIALGGNTGVPELSFTKALTEIEHYGVRIVQTSSSILTPAMGCSAGGDFLNAAAVAETDLSAADVLQLLHHVESGFGRKRSVHWGPRIIDLDLIFYEQQMIDSDETVVPHPCMWYRRFVLEPLAQIAAEWVHPALGESVARLNSRLNSRPLQLEVSSEQISIDMLESIAQSQWGRGQLVFSSADADAAPSPDVFARLIEDFDCTRVQPPLEQGRIIRVRGDLSGHDQTDAATRWRRFLQDFGTAVGR